MITPLTQDQIAMIATLKDTVAKRVDSENSFLHYLPELLEQQVLNPNMCKSYKLFSEAALLPNPASIVEDALKLLNQIVSSEDGSLVPPQQNMFTVKNFTWGELGEHKDARSAIVHIVNKTVTFLNMGKV